MPRYHTKQRAALLSFFEEHADETLSVQQITDALQGAHISLSAVYRNLSELEADGEIRKSSRAGTRKAFYQYMSAKACKGALHLSCKNCGKTVHVDRETAQRLTEQIKVKERFLLDSIDTILYGLCESCQRQ